MKTKNTAYNNRLKSEANERRRMVLRLLESGKTCAEIGKILGGISRQAVSSIAKKGRKEGL